MISNERIDWKKVFKIIMSLRAKKGALSQQEEQLLIALVQQKINKDASNEAARTLEIKFENYLKKLIHKFMDEVDSKVPYQIYFDAVRNSVSESAQAFDLQGNGSARFITLLRLNARRSLYDAIFDFYGITEHYYWENKEFNEFVNKYQDEHKGRYPSYQEIMDGLGYSRKKLFNLLSENKKLSPISIDQIKEEVENGVKDSIRIFSEISLTVKGPEDILFDENKELAVSIFLAIESLIPHDKDIISMHLGYGRYNTKRTDKSIAKKYGKKEEDIHKDIERIKQILQDKIKESDGFYL